MNKVMILKSILSKVVENQRLLLDSKPIIKRNLLSKISQSSSKAKIISGIRRCGKSTLLNIIMKEKPCFHYLNFEDLRIVGFKIDDFERLTEVFDENESDCENYFFDEIQIIEGWEIFIRSFIDRGKNIYITGSNASLLGFELGTKLTGRHIRYELYPFSYSEMLVYTKEIPGINSFERYFKDGGFPEFIKENDIRNHQELLNDILYRDIIVRHSIRSEKVLKNITLFLISNVGKEFSYQNIRKTFNVGSVNTVISFIEYLEDSYLLFSIPKFNFSYKKQITGRKKTYAIDTGFIRSNTVSFSSDLGRILENIVFLELKRNNYTIYYYQNKGECDFVAKNENGFKLFQVCYDLNNDNLEREMNGLKKAMNELKLDYGVILTYNQDDNFKFDNKKIQVISTWKWLKNNEL